MNKPAQLDLIDTTPLALWDKPEDSSPIQLDSGIVYWTPPAKKAAPLCMVCNKKPARSLTGGNAIFCGPACRNKYQKAQTSFDQRISKTKLSDDDGRCLTFEESPKVV
jgi:hypothetical protein